MVKLVQKLTKSISMPRVLNVVSTGFFEFYPFRNRCSFLLAEDQGFNLRTHAGVQLPRQISIPPGPYITIDYGGRSLVKISTETQRPQQLGPYA